MEDIDVYRAAQLLIKQFKEGATAEAIRRSAEIDAKIGKTTANVWWQVAQAIMVLERQEPAANENLQ